jgi:dynein heavy chain
MQCDQNLFIRSVSFAALCHLQALQNMAKGDRQAMAKYNEQQVRQLTRLIEVTRTNLPKSERQKVMNMITIDAHSRDIVANIVEGGCDKQDCFLWMCQLRSYWDASINDCRIRICDASFPYGYEYLGNGPRLVITPLTGGVAAAAGLISSATGCRCNLQQHVCVWSCLGCCKGLATCS